jgi:hypothetical protein
LLLCHHTRPTHQWLYRTPHSMQQLTQWAPEILGAVNIVHPASLLPKLILVLRILRAVWGDSSISILALHSLHRLLDSGVRLDHQSNRSMLLLGRVRFCKC